MCYEVPREIAKRREGVKKLYDGGMSVMDISRYYETSPSAVVLSLDDVYSKDRNKKNNPEGMRQVLQNRNANLQRKIEDGESFTSFGFYKLPSYFSECDDRTPLENLEVELKNCGFTRKEVYSYIKDIDKNYADMILKRNKSICSIEKPFNLCTELLNRGWTQNQVSEFTGLSLMLIRKHRKENENLKTKQGMFLAKYSSIADSMYSDYVNEPRMSKQELASKYNLSRQVVSKILEEKSKELGEPLSKLRVGCFNGRPTAKAIQKKIESLCYTKTPDGKLHKNISESTNKPLTILEMASLVGVSECSIIKYRPSV